MSSPPLMLTLAVLFASLLALCVADPNSKLSKCCAKLPALGDDKDCVERFCNFDSISQTNVLNFLKTCSERGDTVGHMWDCASSRVDHTKCCESKGVQGKCLEYCTAQDGVPTDYSRYLFCLEDFNNIRDCFKDYLAAN